MRISPAPHSSCASRSASARTCLPRPPPWRPGSTATVRKWAWPPWFSSWRQATGSPSASATSIRPFSAPMISATISGSVRRPSSRSASVVHPARLASPRYAFSMSATSAGMSASVAARNVSFAESITRKPSAPAQTRFRPPVPPARAGIRGVREGCGDQIWMFSIQTMRMSEGVEWALHECLNLTWLEPGEAVTAARLAKFYELPAAYLNKQLQALARAGILESTPGPRGGFRLARRPEDITVMDVVAAIEGPESAFRCQELVRRGPGDHEGVDYRKTCSISQTMRRAELAWRRELAAVTLADLKETVETRNPTVPGEVRRGFARLKV